VLPLLPEKPCYPKCGDFILATDFASKLPCDNIDKSNPDVTSGLTDNHKATALAIKERKWFKNSKEKTDGNVAINDEKDSARWSPPHLPLSTWSNPT
jgi:hypothetical protein